MCSTQRRRRRVRPDRAPGRRALADEAKSVGRQAAGCGRPVHRPCRRRVAELRPAGEALAVDAGATVPACVESAVISCRAITGQRQRYAVNLIPQVRPSWSSWACRLLFHHLVLLPVSRLPPTVGLEAAAERRHLQRRLGLRVRRGRGLVLRSRAGVRRGRGYRRHRCGICGAMFADRRGIMGLILLGRGRARRPRALTYIGAMLSVRRGDRARSAVGCVKTICVWHGDFQAQAQASYVAGSPVPAAPHGAGSGLRS